MSRPAIAVVNSSSFGRVFPEHGKRLGRLGTIRRITTSTDDHGVSLARKTRGAVAVVASVSPVFDAEFFRHSPGLRLLARHGIGVNNVDLAAATRHGVIVTKVPGIVEREAMAEHAVGLILAVIRKLKPADAAVGRGRWADRPAFVGRELKSRTVGLVGFGNIGRRTGEILSRGFGARVLAADPFVGAASIRRSGATKVGFARLIGASDVISLHCPLTAATRGMIGTSVLRRMRRGAVLVNTARGELVDERAVTAALRSGRLAGLGTDVVAAEPATRRHPFTRTPNTLLVPHIGAYTEESLRGMGEKMLQDLADVLVRHRRPGEIANPDVATVWR